MAIPANWSTGWIKGKFIDSNGLPVVGDVVITLDVTRIVDAAAATVILPVPLRVSLDVTGYFEQELPATDDPDINPVDFTYMITETWSGGESYSIHVPAGNLASAIDMTQVVRVSASTGIAYIKGDKGDSGDVAGGYEFHQPVASATWTVDHNQDRIPAHPTVLVGGVIKMARIEIPTRNRIIAKFNNPIGPGDLTF